MAVSFVRVVDAGPGWTKVEASDGKTYTLKGDRNWRNNNPGNIEYGDFAKSQGAIGSDGRFAVFPDMQTGTGAQAALQFNSPSYNGKSILAAIERYAPRSENDTSGYANALAYAAGVPVSTRLSDLTPEQRAAYIAAQQRVEGLRPGTIMGEDGEPVSPEIARQFGGAPLPPANIPSVGTALDTSPAGSYTIQRGDTLSGLARRFGTTVDQLAQANGIADPNKIMAGAALRVGAPPPLPQTTFGGRLPATAMNGMDRLVPGQVTQPPTDFAPNTGAPDLRALGMTSPSLLPAGLPFANGALPTAPVPMPRPIMPPAAPQTAAQPLPRPPATPIAPTSVPAPVASPAPQQLRLASGRTIAPGIYQQGDHSVMVSDAGDGTAKIERVRGPGAIPGILDPLSEVNNNTIAGGVIRNMLPKVVAQNASSLVPTVANNAKAAALNAAASLGRSAQGFGSNIFGGFGGLFGGGVPASRGLLAAALPIAGRAAPVAPVPLPRPLVLSIPSGGGGNGGGTHWDPGSGSWVGGGQ